MFTSCAAPVELSALHRQQEQSIFRLLDAVIPFLMQHDPGPIFERLNRQRQFLRTPWDRRRFHVPAVHVPRRSAITADPRIRRQAERRRFCATLPTPFRTDLGPDLLPCFLSGRALPFLAQTCPEYGRALTFRPGSLDDAVAGINSGASSCRLLWSHDPTMELASTRDGTLAVHLESTPLESFNGLMFQARLADDALGRSVAKRILGGKVKCSAGPRIYDSTQLGGVECVTASGLVEISLAENPGYMQTWTKLNFPDERSYFEVLCRCG
jgi:hypothetical protein